jgi:hypothetical protein
MRVDRVLCLANSYKHENRCVAGISLITKKWLRLVGRKVPGCLTQSEACYEDRKEAALLDVFEVELDKECGSNCHPEDVYVTGKPFRLLGRVGDQYEISTLLPHVSKRPSVLQGYGDRVSARRVEESPRERSLEIIRPEDLWWWIRDESGKRKNRAVFRFGTHARTRYDLAVTDPIWLEKMRSLPSGIYPHAYFFQGKAPKTMLTMSLSEPFERFHYKLVAGVVALPN